MVGEAAQSPRGWRVQTMRAIENNVIHSQAGVLPYRIGRHGLQVLLVTARGSDDKWVVPKGNVEVINAPFRCAAREAWEEAGVRGDVSRTIIGAFWSNKRGQLKQVHLYPMRVRRQMAHWPEMHERRRQWVAIEDVPQYIIDRNLIRAFQRLQALVTDRVPMHRIAPAA